MLVINKPQSVLVSLPKRFVTVYMFSLMLKTTV